MERWSAVFIPGLWLQWCMRSAGSNTSEHPNIVVFGAGDDAPIEQLDRAAVRVGLRRGMSLALAKSCCPDAVVHRCDKRMRDEAREAIATALHTWTPKVEPSSTHPGVFLLDPSGMHNFWGSHETWFSEVRRGLRYALGLGHARGVVGWSREGVCLLARLHRGDLDIEDRSSEHRLLAQIPLVRAGWLSPRTRQGFHDVGVETVADLLRLQEASVRERLAVSDGSRTTSPESSSYRGGVVSAKRARLAARTPRGLPARDLSSVEDARKTRARAARRAAGGIDSPRGSRGCRRHARGALDAPDQ